MKMSNIYFGLGIVLCSLTIGLLIFNRADIDVYAVGFLTIACVMQSSIQSIIERLEKTK